MGEEEKTFETDQNPFSFKHFLKNQIEDNGSVSMTNSSSDVVDCDSNNITEPQSHDDDLNNVPFPDVQQDLPMAIKKTKGKKVKISNRNQESSRPQDANPFSFKNFVKKDAAVKTSGRVLQIVDDEVQEITNCIAGIQDQEPLEVDTHKDISQEKSEEINVSNSLVCSDLELNSQEELGDKITKLQNENKKLRKELKEAKQCKEDETKRVASLVKKLKEYEQKENEETMALEKMVHMVEKNLELTTQRALKAEAMTAKLREENKILKSSSVSRDIYDDLVNKHQNSLANIKDHATSAAQCLNATAIKAEESLKQLYSGVDSFKLISELLRSIDKFSNVHNESKT